MVNACLLGVGQRTESEAEAATGRHTQRHGRLFLDQITQSHRLTTGEIQRQIREVQHNKRQETAMTRVIKKLLINIFKNYSIKIIILKLFINIFKNYSIKIIILKLLKLL